MSHLNIEIKARCGHTELIRLALKKHQAKFEGVDRQIDTYFKCAQGRLKLREGDIENCFLHYAREDKAGPKRSVVTMYHTDESGTLKQLLMRGMKVDVIVRKTREIYRLDNMKFHIDQVDGLGSFVEIEAIGKGEAGEEPELRSQCEKFMNRFRIKPKDLVEQSYSDLVRTAEATERATV